jgi:polyphosphate kinase
MVVRSDAGKLRRYVHIGTGNYNPKTARMYEDFGLLTTDPDIGEDVASLFNHLSGYAVQADYHRLLVAPGALREGLIERINREADFAREGKSAQIRIKCNSIVDDAIIDSLYRASQAGVSVDVLVRGICSIRPGVAGVSENIRVRSVLGRFLEHSRVFEFKNGGELESWIGSADMMHRNLDRRVECLVRLGEYDAQTVKQILDLGLSDDSASWHLDETGNWVRHCLDAQGETLLDYQEQLITSRPTRSSQIPATTPRKLENILSRVGLRNVR